MPPRDSILEKLLEISPFPGWDLNALYPFVSNTMSRLEFDVLFPHGKESLISAYQRHLYSLITESVLMMPKNIGSTAKIRWLIHAHFEHIMKYSDAEHAAINELYRPSRLVQTPVCVGKLIDSIWKAAGDTSTDMNYYTKRGTLGLIYTATLMYWHTSDATLDEVMQFFDTRLNNLKSITKNVTNIIPSTDNAIQNIKLLKSIFWEK